MLFMANIIEKYQEYQRMHAEEFRHLLRVVAKEVLKLTESIPEEYYGEIFKKSSDRELLTIRLKNSQKSSEDLGWIVNFENRNIWKEVYPIDFISQKSRDDLNEFLRKYYPGFTCDSYYVVNVCYNMIKFTFKFESGYTDEDFEINDSFRAETKKSNPKKELDVFNCDLGIVLNDEITMLDWQELNMYWLEGGTLCTGYYDSGVICVDIPLDILSDNPLDILSD